jgi:hypothetical protein
MPDKLPLKWDQVEEESTLGPEYVTVVGQCQVTGKKYAVTYKRVELERWLLGKEFIQDAMPTTSEEDREWVQSSTSPEGWRRMFPWRVMVRPLFADEYHEEDRCPTKEDAEEAASYWKSGGCDVRVSKETFNGE